jgi:hypothetical protein
MIGVGWNSVRLFLHVLAATAHARSRNRTALAVFGALTGLSALLAG